MNFRLLLFSIILNIGYCSTICGQLDSTFESEQEIENLIEESALDNEESQILDNLEYLKDNPVNINSANISDLTRIPLIDLTTAGQIVDYIKNNGQVFSVNELYLIKDIDKTILQRVIPFIITGPILKETEKQKKSSIVDFGNLTGSFRSRLLNDIQARKGFTDNKYLGQKNKIYNRFKLEYGKNFQAGFLSEKDAGEKSITDFTTYHIAFKDIAFINKLIIGDFNLEFGQGLALSSPYGFSKGGNAVTSVIKSERNIFPYLSSDENQFFLSFDN